MVIVPVCQVGAVGHVRGAGGWRPHLHRRGFEEGTDPSPVPVWCGGAAVPRLRFLRRPTKGTKKYVEGSLRHLVTKPFINESWRMQMMRVSSP